MSREVEITALEAVAHWFSEAKRAVILTGPELTFEAGIPDAGELHFNPDINSFREDDSVKEKYWEKIAEIYPKISAAEPTAAHKAIYELSILGELDCVITQAVDALLIKAGCENVLQIYSSIHWAQCLNCGKDYRMMETLTEMSRYGRKIPSCAVCRTGILKPPLSFPGQPLPHWEVREAWIKIQNCDFLICAGASLENEPVASFPVQARGGGAKTVVISAAKGSADDYVDAVLYGGPAVVLPALVEEVKRVSSV
ncbi:MAG: hypothetical protein GKS04_00055 [Candidatus Mycalebacterium zealandia]|nr:MAG: hypothetical protein GKS04_00055 [Candidatus Mycalebacterium zealandia]